MILFVGEHPAYPAIYGLLLRMGLTVATTPEPGAKYQAILVGAGGTSLTLPGDALTALQGQQCPVLVLSTGDMFGSQASNRSNLKKESISENWLPTIVDEDVLIPLVVERTVARQVPCTIFRLFDVYGPFVNGLIHHWSNALRANAEVLVPGPVHQSRSWLYVEDLESLLRQWFENPVPGLFHVGSSYELSFVSVIERLSELHKRTPVIRQLSQGPHAWWRQADTRKVAATYQWEATTSVNLGLLKCANIGT